MASLRFRKNGTPFVDFRAHGKRHRPEFTSLKDAKKFLVLADADPLEAYGFWIESQKPQSAERGSNFLSFKEKVQSFNDNYCEKRVRGVEMKGTMNRLFDFISNKYGVDDMDLREVIFEDLEEFQMSLKKSGVRKKTGLSNASINRQFSTIKTFFKRQFMARYIPVDIAGLIENLPVEVIQRDAWKDESTMRLVERLEQEGADQVLIEIVKSNEWSPFGPIDYSRLKWKALDFEGGEIHTFRLKGKGKREWNVPMLPGFKAQLKAILKRHTAAGFGGPNDHVYLDKEWKPINPGLISKQLERHRKALGIKEVPYSSRHRMITEVAKRTDRDTASKFAGHASLRTTEKHYLVGGNEDLKKKLKKAFK